MLALRNKVTQTTLVYKQHGGLASILYMVSEVVDKMAQNIQLKPPVPLSLDGNVAQNWKEFRRSWELFALAAELNKKDEPVQVATFLHVAGTVAQQVFDTFQFADADDRKKIEPVIEKFAGYCEPKKNITVNRYVFNTRQQKMNETFTDYLTALRTLIKDCSLPPDLADEFLRDRIVCGIMNEKVRERLLRTDDLTLKKAIDTCKVAEISVDQMKSLSLNGIGNSMNVDDVKRLDSRQSRGRSSHKPRSKTSYNKIQCNNCPYEHEVGKCPAQGKTCRKCSKPNHFASKCRSSGHHSQHTRNTTQQANQRTAPRLRSNGYSSRPQSVKIITTHEDTSDEEGLPFTIDNITSVRTVETGQRAKDWTQRCDILGNSVDFKLDSGSQVDIIPESVFRSLPNKAKMQPTTIALKSYSNHIIKPIGQVNIEVKVTRLDSNDKITYSKPIPITFQVVKGSVVPILGRHSCERMGLLKIVFIVQPCTTANDNCATDQKENFIQADSVAGNYTNMSQCVPQRENKSNPIVKHKASKHAEELIVNNKDLFEGLGCLNKREYDIQVDPTVCPIQLPPRQIPHKIRDKVKAELERMVGIDVIEPVTEPTEWVSQITTVIKKNGQVRVCLDPRELNKAIRRQHYPTTVLEDVVSRMPNARVFSKFDATSGYWQLRLSEKSSELTPFNTPWGRYKFKRMPFGISSAGEIWQRAMVEEFGDLEGFEVIIDDMLIYGDSEIEHDKRLAPFLKRVRKSGLKFNRPKCEISVDQVEFSGHLLTSNGLKPSPSRIRALTEMPKPQTKVELQTFLGIMVYLAKFVPNLSALTAPLRELLSKGVEWSWEKRHDIAFDKLISVATETPVLKYYDAKKPVTVSTDASNKGYGAMISRNSQPVAYASRRLNKVEINYAPIEKEMSAIVFGCTRFHDYIFGAKTLVETDHKPLIGIFNKPLHKLSPVYNVCA